jgi:hypothetical protein
MDEKINKWLQTYEPINDIAEIEEIHYERGTENVRNLALQRAGFANLPARYITSRGWHRQYQYMLFLRSESEIDIQRLENLDWLDDLSNWLDEQSNAGNFPVLDNGRIVEKVSCANALTYQEDEDGAISLYSLQLYFDIRKEN